MVVIRLVLAKFGIIRENLINIVNILTYVRTFTIFYLDLFTACQAPPLNQIEVFLLTNSEAFRMYGLVTGVTVDHVVLQSLLITLHALVDLRPTVITFVIVTL